MRSDAKRLPPVRQGKLLSRVKRWHWLVTWDNPQPADSSTMISALGALGRLTQVQTKTTWVLAPKKNGNWRAIRQAIVANLHPRKGNAVYVNLRSGKIFEWGSQTERAWKSAN